eukprot:6426348-Lingulodinium_polyedra.AAC.1
MPASAINRSRPMATCDFTVELRRLLSTHGGVEASDAAEWSARSLKATALSWLSKYGIKGALKRQLGYHSKPKDRVPAEYNRDANAAALRVLADVVLAIRSRQFLPDATRSGMLARGDSKLGD